METYTVEMKSTIQNMEGAWQFENVKDGKKEEIKLFIGHEKCRFKKIVDGTEIENFEFPGNAHWFGPWLCFIDSEKHFYTRYANPEQLIFGEYDGAVIGQPIWEHKFLRDSSLN